MPQSATPAWDGFPPQPLDGQVERDRRIGPAIQRRQHDPGQPGHGRHPASQRAGRRPDSRTAAARRMAESSAAPPPAASRVKSRPDRGAAGVGRPISSPRFFSEAAGGFLGRLDARATASPKGRLPLPRGQEGRGGGRRDQARAAADHPGEIAAAKVAADQRQRPRRGSFSRRRARVPASEPTRPRTANPSANTWRTTSRRVAPSAIASSRANWAGPPPRHRQ